MPAATIATITCNIQEVDYEKDERPGNFAWTLFDSYIGIMSEYTDRFPEITITPTDHTTVTIETAEADDLAWALHAIASGTAAHHLGFIKAPVGAHRALCTLLDPKGAILAQATDDKHPNGIHRALRRTADELQNLHQNRARLLARGREMGMSDRMMARCARLSHTQVANILTE